MDEEVRMQDLNVDELQELLAEDGVTLSFEQAATLKALLGELGGLDEALEVFERISRAA